MSHNKLFIDWLNDAYAMENKITEVLEQHAEQAKDYPEVQKKIQEHLDVTREQAERIKKCIEDMGESVSGVKSVMSDMMGKMEGMSTAMASDKLVKNALAEYTTEHMEIAAYTALITAAEELGHPEVAEVCKKNMKEEEEMAEWLKENMPMTVKKVLNEHHD